MHLLLLPVITLLFVQRRQINLKSNGFLGNCETRSMTLKKTGNILQNLGEKQRTKYASAENKIRKKVKELIDI